MHARFQSTVRSLILGGTSGVFAWAVLWFSRELPSQTHAYVLGGLSVVQVLTEIFASRTIPDLTTLLAKTEFSVEQRRKLEHHWTKLRGELRLFWVLSIASKACMATIAGTLFKFDQGSLGYLWAVYAGYALLGLSLWTACYAYNRMLGVEADRNEIARVETEIRERKQMMAQFASGKSVDDSPEMRKALESYAKPSRRLGPKAKRSVKRAALG